MLQRLARLYKQTADDKSTKTHSTALVVVKPDSESPWGNQFGFLHVSAPELTGTRFSKPLEFVTIAQEIIQRKTSSLAVNLTGRLLEILSKFRGPEAMIHLSIAAPIDLCQAVEVPRTCIRYKGFDKSCSIIIAIYD
ncbi:hypothetical protein OIU84_021310 [Salix udensis]|uniref:O-acyltransferase WSD1 C-terminal domain-containing protein n=1 Tax=Salix udensis TaxID=889485 RepID=A0AAD6KUM6_9ROSI|nr:hypothetical protein OIU84_021310 [Salix udensis]